MEFKEFIGYILILTYCAINIVLGGIGIAIIMFINKRLIQSSTLKKILAIVTGIVIVMGSRYSLSILYVAIFLYGTSSAPELLSLVSTSIPMIVFSLLFTVLGGYIAGKIAHQNEIMYGLVTGVGVLVISYLPKLIGNPNLNLYLILELAVSFIAATLGGYFAFIHRKQLQEKLIVKGEIQ